MKSIRTKLGLLITVLIGISLLSISFFGYTNAKKALNKMNSDYIQSEVRANQDALASYFGEKVKMVEGIANLEGLQSVNESLGVRTLQNIYPKMQNDFINVSFANADGVRWNYKGEEGSIAERNYFHQAMSTGKTTISDVLVSGTHGALSIVIASPIMPNGGNPVGVAYTTLPLDEILARIQEVQYGETGFGYMFTEAGVVISHGRRQDITGKAVLQEAVRNDAELTFVEDAEVQSYWEHRNDGTPFTIKIDGTENVNYIVPLSIPTVNPVYFGFSVSKKELNHEIDMLLIAFIVISVIVMVVAIAVSMFFITKLITSNIKKLRDIATEIAAGNLNISVDVDSNDEIGEVAAAMGDTVSRLNSYMAYIQEITNVLDEIADGNLRFNLEQEYVGEFEKIKLALENISDSLNSTIGDINQSSEQVLSGSEQVSAGAQALSQGATEQASSVEELAATINEISAQISSNADNAKTADEQAANVVTEADESNQRMRDMLSAMDDINDSSKKISKIIKDIEDIAFQTNILALNAAVEAARAGAAGKGFAVVADEVRNLASKSAEASQNTATLIEGSLRAVENGIRIANDTAASLENVVNGINTVTGTVSKISEASDAQAKSASQIAQGIDQISSVVQTNSATAEQSAAASEELSGQAHMLKELVNRFKLKDVSGDSDFSKKILESAMSDDIEKDIKQAFGSSSKY